MKKTNRKVPQSVKVKRRIEAKVVELVAQKELEHLNELQNKDQKINRLEQQSADYKRMADESDFQAENLAKVADGYDHQARQLNEQLLEKTERLNQKTRDLANVEIALEKKQERVEKLEREVDQLTKMQFVKTEILQSPSSLTNDIAGMDTDQFLDSLNRKPSPAFVVDNWRDSWKWISSWCLLLISFFATVEIPPELIAVLPATWREYIITFTAFCGFVGRYINQSGFKNGGLVPPKSGF